MSARTGVEVMWDAFLKKFVVKGAVDAVEEVLCATVHDDFKRARLKKMREVYHCIVLPVLREFFYRTEFDVEAPVLRERADVYAS